MLNLKKYFLVYLIQYFQFFFLLWFSIMQNLNHLNESILIDLKIDKGQWIQ